MEETTFYCDNCKKEAKDAIPAGWYLLGFARIKEIEFPSGLNWQISHHFCGEECMNRAVAVNRRTNV